MKHEEPEYGYFTVEQRKELLAQIMAAASPEEVVGLIEGHVQGIRHTADSMKLRTAYNAGRRNGYAAGMLAADNLKIWELRSKLLDVIDGFDSWWRLDYESKQKEAFRAENKEWNEVCEL